MSDTQIARLRVCHDPSILFGGEAEMAAALQEPEYAHLQDWAESMRRIREYCPALPTGWNLIPPRQPDVFCEEGDPPVRYAGIVIIDGDSLSGLFGCVWKAVYDLGINESFRSQFPDPNAIRPGATIYFPCGFRFGDDSPWDAECDETYQEVELPPLSSDEVDFARAHADSDEDPNNLSCTTSVAYEGTIWSDRVELDKCQGIVALDAEVKFSILIDPEIKGRVIVSWDGQSRTVDCETNVSLHDQEVTLELDGQEYKLSQLGAMVPSSGAKEAESAGTIKFEGPSPKRGNFEISSSAEFSDGKIKLKCEGKYLYEFRVAPSGECLTDESSDGAYKVSGDVSFSFTLEIDLLALANQTACAGWRTTSAAELPAQVAAELPGFVDYGTQEQEELPTEIEPDPIIEVAPVETPWWLIPIIFLKKAPQAASQATPQATPKAMPKAATPLIFIIIPECFLNPAAFCDGGRTETPLG